MTETAQKIQNPATDRIIYFDILRIISAFFVVMIHVTAGPIIRLQNDPGFNSVDYNTGVMVFYNVLARGAVPIFFMISGALLLTGKSDASLKTVYTKRIPRILIPLAVWTAFYAAVLFLSGLRHSGLSAALTANSIAEIFAGHYHLWFLYVLIVLYMLIPVLNLLASSRKILLYFCGIIFIFSAISKPVMPLLYSVQRVLDQNFENGILVLASKICRFGINCLDLLFSHFSVTNEFSNHLLSFLLGAVLAGIVLTKKQKSCLYLCGFACLVFMYFASIFKLLRHSQYDFFLSGIPAIIFAAAVFVLTKEICSQTNFSSIWRKIISGLGRYSFGIYLVHAFFIERVFRRFFADITPEYPLLFWLGYSAAVFAASFVSCRMIAGIRFLRKLVM